MTDVWTWMRGRRGLVDAVLAAGLWLVFAWLPTGAVFFRPYLYDSDLQVRLAIGVLMAAPVAVRRSHPSAALVASCAAGLVHLAVLASIQAIDVCFLVVIYAMAAYEPRRRARHVALGVGWLASIVCALRWATAFGSGNHFPTVVILLGLSVTVTWTGGALVRTRRAATEQALERARQLEIDAERQMRLAAAQERAQIARELHDIVAHSLAVMIVQADGGRYVAAADPARAAAALETIAATGREALSQMRHLLGVLRDGERGAPAGVAGPPAPMNPQPVLADLAALLDGVRGAGVAMQVRLPDPLPAVPPQVAAVAYRIVQESLTNVLKHAGARAAVEVSLSCTEAGLVVQVSDDGYGSGFAVAPADAGDGTGRGLLGMRERAGLVAGRVSAGPIPGGGWRVRAILPVAVAAGIASGTVRTGVPATVGS